MVYLTYRTIIYFVNAGFKILADRRILEIHRQVPKSGRCRQWADAPASKRWEEPMIAESAIGRKKRCNLHGHTVFLPNRKIYSSLRLSSLVFTGFRAYKKQMTGIEPASSAWKAGVLPLNYARKIWSGRQDLNLRHPAPKAGALPNCATSRRC